MDNITVDIESLGQVANALEVYIEEVQNNIQKMKDAATDCSDNMGTDVYSQKAIIELNSCIKSLRETIQEAESLKIAILKKIQEIEESDDVF